MSDNLANLFASKFIARTDARARQSQDGVWYLDTNTRKRDGQRLGWNREALDAHISGTSTYGHYLLSSESKCKLFAFDIDLEKSGTIPSVSLSTEGLAGLEDAQLQEAYKTWDASFYEETDLREAWLNRAHPGRDFMKFQFKHLAHMFARAIRTELDLPCAVAYSGGKGVHVYAFTGLIDAVQAYEGARIIIDALGCFEPLRGEHFIKHKDNDVLTGFPNLSVEVFPKQGSLEGKDLGNLMGLPLGRNLKAPKEPKFFIDMTTPMAVFAPIDPVVALNSNDPFGY